MQTTKQQTKSPQVQQHRFRVMGSDAHVLVVGPGSASDTDDAIAMAQRLEQKWSRFEPSSEISALNRAQGTAVALSPETIELIRRSKQANVYTQGRFNPLLGSQLIQLGYDRDFAGLAGNSPAGTGPLVRGGGADVCDIIIDDKNQTVALPPGASFDPGGIGKGFAADLIVETLMAQGAQGALCNLGGDLRVAGRGPDNEPNDEPNDGRWNIGVKDDIAKGHNVVLSLASGAVATSTCKRRSWTVAGTTHHHLLDPATGGSATNAARLVTVVAAQAWQAEFLATALAVGGEQFGEPELGDAAALVTTDSGTRKLGPIDDFIVQDSI